MVKLIFFDMGGTLVEGDGLFREFAVEMGSDTSETVSYLAKSFVDVKAGANSFMTVKEILSESCKIVAVKHNLKDISGQAGQIYSNYFLKRANLIKGALFILKELKKIGVSMIVASDADSDVLIEELEILGIKDFFDDFLISSDLKAYKPEEGFVVSAKKLVQGKENEALFIGDSSVDVDTAKKLGIKSVLFNQEGKFSYDADYQISDLKEILSLCQ